MKIIFYPTLKRCKKITFGEYENLPLFRLILMYWFFFGQISKKYGFPCRYILRYRNKIWATIYMSEIFIFIFYIGKFVRYEIIARLQHKLVQVQDQINFYKNKLHSDMKIVIKDQQSLMKVYDGPEPNYENIVEFVRKAFPKIKNPLLSYIDDQRDNVWMCSQQDFFNMKEMFPDRKIMKIDVCDRPVNKPQDEKNIEQKNDQIKLSQNDEQVQEDQYFQNQIIVQAEKSQRDNNQISEQIQKKQEKKNKKKPDDKFTHKFNKLREVMRAEVDEMIQDKFKAQIPILLDILEYRFKNKDQFLPPPQGEPHKNIRCDGCGIEPICGVRYKCLKTMHNFCSICEEKYDYPYDLLKIKKPRPDNDEQDLQKKQKREKKLMKCAKKFVEVCNRSSSRDSDHSRGRRKWKRRFHPWWRRDQEINANQNEQKDQQQSFQPPFQHPYLHHMHALYGRSKYNQQSQMKESTPQTMEKQVKREQEKKQKIKQQKKQSPEERVKRLCHKMGIRFGKPEESFRDFIISKINLNIDQLSKIYKAQNPDQGHLEKINMKMRKLAIYLDKDDEQFRNLVQSNPTKNVRQLLQILGEKVDEEKINKMKKKYDRQEAIKKSWASQKKKSQIKNTEKQGNKEEKKEENFLEKLQQKREENVEDKQQEEVIPQVLIKKASQKMQIKLSSLRLSSKEDREKGRILIDMKEIFGDEKAGQIFRFIEQHFHEGQQKIIDLWLKKQYDESKSQ